MSRIEQSPASPDLSQYDLPSAITQQRLSEFGVMSIDDLHRVLDVSEHVKSAFWELEIFLKPGDEEDLSAMRCTMLKRRFIGYIEASLSGNPFPGDNYSIAKARKLLEAARASVWTSESIHSEVARLKAEFEASLKA